MHQIWLLFEATKRRDEAGAKAFEGIGIPGVLGPEWRQFIQAGEEYLHKNAAASYPNANDPCAYCQQPLTAKALSLIKKYRDFSSNDIKAALDVAERQLRGYISHVLALNVIRSAAPGEANDASDVLYPIAPTIEQVKNLKLAVTSRSSLRGRQD
jgi:hypothetical protein